MDSLAPTYCGSFSFPLVVRGGSFANVLILDVAIVCGRSANHYDPAKLRLDDTSTSASDQPHSDMISGFQQAHKDTKLRMYFM